MLFKKMLLKKMSFLFVSGFMCFASSFPVFANNPEAIVIGNHETVIVDGVVGWQVDPEAVIVNRYTIDNSMLRNNIVHHEVIEMSDGTIMNNITELVSSFVVIYDEDGNIVEEGYVVGGEREEGDVVFYDGDIGEYVEEQDVVIYGVIYEDDETLGLSRSIDETLRSSRSSSGNFSNLYIQRVGGRSANGQVAGTAVFEHDVRGRWNSGNNTAEFTYMFCSLVTPAFAQRYSHPGNNNQAIGRSGSRAWAHYIDLSRVFRTNFEYSLSTSGNVTVTTTNPR